MLDLKAIRESKGMSQEVLANAVGISRQAIGAFEAGIHKPSVDTAKKLGKILDITWSDFFED